MKKFKFFKKEGIKKLPEKSGVYCFKEKKNLYIGKASNIRERIKSHFQQPGYKDYLFLDKVKKIGYIKTNSEIEALILEANLIKKYQPKYNVMWRDDKNYFYVAITKEDFPKIFITHQSKLEIKNLKLTIDCIGPFVDGKALKKTLKVLRRVFPYYTRKEHQKGLCPWCHLELCPGPNPSKTEYQKNIKKLVSVLKGKRRMVSKNLKKEMERASTLGEFEKAAEIRDRLFALERIVLNAKILESQQKEIRYRVTEEELKKILNTKRKVKRIEAYDISNISGKLATGSMITFINGKSAKDLYRKFKIKISDKPDDTAMIKEIISRRFKHTEWGYPDLIIIDGGKAQLNAALHCLKPGVKKVKVAALAKKKNELYLENKKPLLLKDLPRGASNLMLQLRDEAHRFAISYHQKLRKNKLLDG